MELESLPLFHNISRLSCQLLWIQISDNEICFEYCLHLRWINFCQILRQQCLKNVLCFSNITVINVSSESISSKGRASAALIFILLWFNVMEFCCFINWLSIGISMIPTSIVTFIIQFFDIRKVLFKIILQYSHLGIKSL